MKSFLGILLCISLAIASAGVSECCCAGKTLSVTIESSCCLAPDEEVDRGDRIDVEVPLSETCGCSDAHAGATDRLIAIVANTDPLPPIANQLIEVGTAQLAAYTPDSPGFYQVPERSPPQSVGTPIRIRFCSFVI